jgi:hypothetical protein
MACEQKLLGGLITTSPGPLLKDFLELRRISRQVHDLFRGDMHGSDLRIGNFWMTLVVESRSKRRCWQRRTAHIRSAAGSLTATEPVRALLAPDLLVGLGERLA